MWGASSTATPPPSAGLNDTPDFVSAAAAKALNKQAGAAGTVTPLVAAPGGGARPQAPNYGSL